MATILRGSDNLDSFKVLSEELAGSIVTDASGRVTMPYQPIIAGQMGTAMTHPSSDQTLKFNQFWANRGGISHNQTNGRFTVPKAGVYRITLNPFFKSGSGPGRVLIGINTDSPTVSTAYGQTYRESATYDTGCLNTVVTLQANDFIVFRLSQGALYNQSIDLFNQFSIELIG